MRYSPIDDDQMRDYEDRWADDLPQRIDRKERDEAHTTETHSELVPIPEFEILGSCPYCGAGEGDQCSDEGTEYGMLVHESRLTETQRGERR